MQGPIKRMPQYKGPTRPNLTSVLNRWEKYSSSWFWPIKTIPLNWKMLLFAPVLCRCPLSDFRPYWLPSRGFPTAIPLKGILPIGCSILFSQRPHQSWFSDLFNYTGKNYIPGAKFARVRSPFLGCSAHTLYGFDAVSFGTLATWLTGNSLW